MSGSNTPSREGATGWQPTVRVYLCFLREADEFLPMSFGSSGQ
jgi:hypothetical protein